MGENGGIVPPLFQPMLPLLHGVCGGWGFLGTPLCAAHVDSLLTSIHFIIDIVARTEEVPVQAELALSLTAALGRACSVLCESLAGRVALTGNAPFGSHGPCRVCAAV